jgi:Suppressor of fused protein (SUFU)
MPHKLFDETCKARDKLYASLGNVEPDVIAHIINPAFMGGPAWPALRQAFSVVHRGNNTIVISNGLSDPFDDVEEKNSGFGIEIYAETKERIEGFVAESSLFKLVYAIAQQAAHSGQMADFVRKYEVITMELYANDCRLHEYQNENGMVGIIIGVEHPDIPKKLDFPSGEVTLATVQILTPEELHYVAEARAEGRNNLHEKLKASGIYHFLTPGRQSLIDAPVLQPELVSLIRNQTSETKPWWKFW